MRDLRFEAASSPTRMMAADTARTESPSSSTETGLRGTRSKTMPLLTQVRTATSSGIEREKSPPMTTFEPTATSATTSARQAPQNTVATVRLRRQLCRSPMVLNIAASDH